MHWPRPHWDCRTNGVTKRQPTASGFSWNAVSWGAVIPVVDVRARIHGSFFTEAAELNQDALQNSLTRLVDGTAQIL